jgi:hypothetical protein
MCFIIIEPCCKIFIYTFYYYLYFRFEEAIRLLDNVRSIPSEKEQVEHQNMLHILHTNLAIIYNTMNEPAKACTHSRLALEIQPGNPKTYLQ